MIGNDLMTFLVLMYGPIYALVLTASEALTSRILSRQLRKCIDQRMDRRVKIKKAFVKGDRYSMASAFISGVILTGGYLLLVEDDQIRLFLLGYSLAAIVLTLHFINRGSMDMFKSRSVKNEFRQIMEGGNRHQFKALVLGSLDFDRLRFKVLAVQAMERWGAPDLVPILEELHKKTPSGHTFRPPGLKEITREALERVQDGEGQLESKDKNVWLGLAKNFKLPWRILRAASNKSTTEYKALVEGLAPKSFSLLQYELHQCYPNAVCRDCRSRAEKVAHDFGTLVQCTTCGKSDSLEQGVKRLVGRIGKGKDWERKGESLYVQLWNDEKEKAKYAEIDGLTFGEMHSGNADWVLASVLETLHNQMPEGKRPLFLENEPPAELSRNALLQLERLTTAS